MTDTSNYYAGRLTADALHLAVSLDSFTTLDWAERIGPAVQQGKKKLIELKRQRQSLIVSRADGAIIDWVLETAHARLDFLERLDLAMCRTAPKDEPQSRPEQLPHGSCDSQTGRARESRPGVLEFYDDQAA